MKFGGAHGTFTLHTNIDSLVTIMQTSAIFSRFGDWWFALLNYVAQHMNPIEKLWMDPSQQINLLMNQRNNVAKLREELISTWDAIYSYSNSALAKIMPRCLRALMDAQGKKRNVVFSCLSFISCHEPNVNQLLLMLFYPCETCLKWKSKLTQWK